MQNLCSKLHKHINRLIQYFIEQSTGLSWWKSFEKLKYMNHLHL